MASRSDVVFVQDLTGSFSNDLPNARVLIPAVVNRITNPILESIFGKDLKVGLASFKDKPVSPLGNSGDYVYRAELGLTDNPTKVKKEYNTFRASGGADGPEAQLDALLYTALDSGGGLGYRAGSSRVAIIATDAVFHKAGDRDKLTSEAGVVPNNGDAVIGPLEDYVSIPKLKTALKARNVTPVFLVTKGNETTYNKLVKDLGQGGGVVSLDSKSENVSDAIKQAIGLARGVITQPELTSSGNDVINLGSFSPANLNKDKVIFAGDGDDQVFLFGDTKNNFVDGGAGADLITNGDGSDRSLGGSGNDFLLGGKGNDTMFGSSGNDNITGDDGKDFLQGDSGNDILTGGTGADTFAFDTGGKFVRSELGVDTINDFNPSQNDKIRLSKDTFTALSNTLFPSALNIKDFALVTNDAAAATTGAEIAYNKNNGNLFYNPNGAAGGFAEGGLFVTLTGAPTLTRGNFEVVRAS